MTSLPFELLKSLQGCINVNEYFETLLRFWERLEYLARVRQREGVHYDTASSDEEPERHDSQRSDETMHACELGVRAPLYFMALHRCDLHHTRASLGRSQNGRQSFSVWSLAHGARLRDKVRTSMHLTARADVLTAAFIRLQQRTQLWQFCPGNWLSSRLHTSRLH